MGEVPSYKLKQIKIPTNETRIRWGIGRPHHPDVKENNESIASEWAKLIKAKGAALVHGKLNSYWFDDSGTPQPIHEPPFEDHGTINLTDNKFYHGSAPNPINGILDASRNADPTTQYLIMSQPVDPNFEPDQALLKRLNDLIYREGWGSPNITREMKRQTKLKGCTDYNTERLGGRFSSAWREISWVFFADQNQTKIGEDKKNIVSWRGDYSINVNLCIFLPNEEAIHLFTQIQTHPDELQHLLGILYPKITGEYPLKTIHGNTLKLIRDVDPVETSFSHIIEGAPIIPFK